MFKVGGSLFDLADLRERLRPHFNSPAHQSVVLFGGGPSVDELRQQTSHGSVDNVDAHWQAIDLMSHSAECQSKCWPGIVLVRSIAELSETMTSPVALDIAHDLRMDGGSTLPIGWEVTSDSIAAWLAHRIGASDLVLVKSVGGSEVILIEDAVAHGWVDDYFPRAASTLPAKRCALGWINARLNPADRVELRFSSPSLANDKAE